MITDARFSGVSTGACIGHVGPEALAGGPIGRVRDGDLIRIVVDRDAPGGHGRPRRPTATSRGRPRRPPTCSPARRPHPDLAPDPDLPGRHPALGRAAGRRRRHVGRLRLRRGRDRAHARGRPPARSPPAMPRSDPASRRPELHRPTRARPKSQPVWAENDHLRAAARPRRAGAVAVGSAGCGGACQRWSSRRSWPSGWWAPSRWPPARRRRPSDSGPCPPRGRRASCPA